MTAFCTLHITYLPLHTFVKHLFLASKANGEFVVMLFATYNLLVCPAQSNQQNVHFYKAL